MNRREEGGKLPPDQHDNFNTTVGHEQSVEERQTSRPDGEGLDPLKGEREQNAPYKPSSRSRTEYEEGPTV